MIKKKSTAGSLRFPVDDITEAADDISPEIMKALAYDFR
jgi:hypothetical protein